MDVKLCRKFKFCSEHWHAALYEDVGNNSDDAKLQSCASPSINICFLQNIVSQYTSSGWVGWLRFKDNFNVS